MLIYSLVGGFQLEEILLSFEVVLLPLGHGPELVGGDAKNLLELVFGEVILEEGGREVGQNKCECTYYMEIEYKLYNIMIYSLEQNWYI